VPAGEEEDGTVEEPAPAAATPEPGAPADAATAEAIGAAVVTYFACAADGDWAGVVSLSSPSVLAAFGTANPYDVVAIYEAGGTPGVLRALGDARTHADGRVSAEVTYTGLGVTPFQLARERWYFVAVGGRLLLDSADVLPPVVPAGADQAVLEIVMVDFAFEPAASSVPAAEYIVLHGISRGAYDHEIEVKRLPPGATFEQVFADEALQEQTVDIGYLELAPGGEGDLVLVGLEPGAYTLMCFFEEPDGELHALKGMTAEFRVGE
jgi:uncharacterized cupredoxin-like copper-binding protein